MSTQANHNHVPRDTGEHTMPAGADVSVEDQMLRELASSAPRDPERDAELCTRYGVELALPPVAAGAVLHHG